jgi:hypothetical protein
MPLNLYKAVVIFLWGTKVLLILAFVMCLGIPQRYV